MTRADIPPAANDGGAGPTARSVAPSTISAWHVATALVIVLAAVVRLWAADGDLWLDEIWSYALTSMVDAAWKIFTEVRHDNNHHLISLWISQLGSEVGPPMVRAPSIFAGIGTVLLAAVIARRWGLREMLIAAVLTASSYVTINYSAEARGYSLAGFFALAGMLVFERYLDTNRWQPLVLFWILVPLGFFSHLTFLHFYFGALLWSMARWLKAGLSRRVLLAKIACCHAWPVAFLIAFYFVSLRGIEIGGGNMPGIPAVIAKSLALSVGGPLALSTDQLLIALLAAGGGLVALVLMYREGSDLWIVFLSTIFLSPLFLLVEQPHSGLFVRYFFVNIVFNLLLFTYLLGRISAAGSLGAAAGVALVASIVAGNAQRLREFSVGGRRGEYREAVRYIIDHSTEPVIEVGVDHPRTRLVLVLYIPPGRSLTYTDPAPAPTAKNQWYIAHNEDGLAQFADRITDQTGRPFELAHVSRHAGLSGFDWAIYHRVAPSGTTK